METDELIKRLARWIAAAHPKRKIIGRCCALIGQDKHDEENWCEIEEMPEDGFCGFEDWYVCLDVTPEVECEAWGGYPGCDPDDIERVIMDVTGIADCRVKRVAFTDDGGDDFLMPDSMKMQLEDELMKLWK